MATEVAVQQPTLASYAGRSQARPKPTLFGTVLENVDKSQLKGINPTLANKFGVKSRPERYPIPEDLQEHVQARLVVEKAHNDINSQHQKLVEAQKELKQKQLKALRFTREPEDKPACLTREGPWLSLQDLEHSSDINNVGIGKSGGYNRDRYSKKPPTHSYALIGDVLGKGNEFGQPQIYDPDESLIALNLSQNNNKEMIRLGFNPPVDPDVEAPLKKQSCIDMPPNIRHKFGSKVCDDLLQDPTTVRALLEKERRSKPLVRSKFEVDTKEYTAKAESGNYFEVGQVTRYNIFPGHSTLNQSGVFNAVHNDVVYLRREQINEEFRMVKDAYAAWAEQNLVREKLKKLWNAPKTTPS